jgi:DNA-binding Xre family transcriptional regulator
MTTTELAKKVGISQAQISRLENGLQGFRSDTLLEIGLALGVSPAELLKAWKD